MVYSGDFPRGICDLIFLSRAFYTSLTLCPCLRMVTEAQRPEQGRALSSIYISSAVAEGTDLDVYKHPDPVHLLALVRGGSLKVARFLKERTPLQLFHGHQSFKYRFYKPNKFIFSHHSNTPYSLRFSYTHSSSAN